MATRTSQTTERTLGATSDGNATKTLISTIGLKHHEEHYSDIDDGETITPGPASIVRAAFEVDAAGDDINVVVTNGTTLTFNAGASSAHSGIVHYWTRGY
tara:strand:+ start:85 stop:384 length:300 start_codon:yes stop_codon:yes gene_type:complete